MATDRFNREKRYRKTSFSVYSALYSGPCKPIQIQNLPGKLQTQMNLILSPATLEFYFV